MIDVFKNFRGYIEGGSDVFYVIVESRIWTSWVKLEVVDNVS